MMIGQVVVERGLYNSPCSPQALFATRVAQFGIS